MFISGKNLLKKAYPHWLTEQHSPMLHINSVFVKALTGHWVSCLTRERVALLWSLKSKVHTLSFSIKTSVLPSPPERSCHLPVFSWRSSVLAELAARHEQVKGSQEQTQRERERDFPLTLPPASTGILGLFYPFLICILMKMQWGTGRSRMKGLRWIKPVWDTGNSLYPVVRNQKHHYMAQLYNTSWRRLW